MSIEAQPQAHNLFSFQIDWIKDKLDEIDANESPLAPKLRGIWRSAFSVINVKKIYIIVTKNKTKLLPECVWELRLEGELRCPLGLWREDNIFLIMNRTSTRRQQNTFFVIYYFLPWMLWSFWLAIWRPKMQRTWRDFPDEQR